MAAGNQPKSFVDSFRILHDSDTDMGTVMLRKRWSMALDRDVFEMTMDGKLMMSSAVAVSECALAERALALLPNQDLNVLIGGLGFGFTSQTALSDPRVRALTVIERLDPVIEWHRSGILPWTEEFHGDRRLEVVMDDFFAFVARPPLSRYEAILIDIDDSPDRLWHGSHAAFYESTGLAAIAKHLAPGGVFALWSATSPAEAFLEKVGTTFATMELVPVHFENPCLRQPETNYILLARMPSRERQFAT
ncbi:MAG: spermidine synthase [Planctomycetota bacterium]